MSLLYKPKEEQTLTCDIEVDKQGKIIIDFSSDCGKFGTDEMFLSMIKVMGYSSDTIKEFYDE